MKTFSARRHVLFSAACGLVCAWTLGTFPFGGTTRAAETASSSDEQAYKPASPYRKTMPGSTKKIAGSKPRTYIQPKKQTYQEHMASLSTHRFKNETSSSFGTKKAAPGGPASGSKPSSLIRVRKGIGKPVTGLSGGQPLSSKDVAFLMQLSGTVRPKAASVANQLDQIVAGQKQGRTLTPAEYDLLTQLADQVGDGQAAYRLNSIAAKRRNTGNRGGAS